MNKFKRLKSTLFITGVAFCIAILFNIGQVSEVPSRTYSTQKNHAINLVKEQNIKKTVEISRSTKIRRTTDGNKDNNSHLTDPTEKSIGTAPASVSPTAPPEAKSSPAAPPEAKSSPAAPPEAKSSPAAPKEAGKYSADDLDLLARLITAEAQSEPYDAKVAVGAVVMNRVKSSSFPDAIRDVIYQKIDGYYQFTPVENGWIDKPADSDSIKAAKSALDGTDPTNGALFYYDNLTTNTWIMAKPISMKSGNMIYAY